MRKMLRDFSFCHLVSNGSVIAFPGMMVCKRKTDLVSIYDRI